MTSTGWRAAVLAALLLVMAAAGHAATWRSAPLFGGDMQSVVFAPNDPQVAIAGTATGQVYRSRDGGATWSHAGRLFPLSGWVVAGLQFDPNRPTRLWAALRGVFGGGSVVSSDDLGATWELRASRPDDEIFALALVPGEEGRLLIGTRSGVWGSRDAGKSWKRLSTAQAELVEVSSLLVHPQHPQTVLAGTFRRAFRSDDGGVTWRGVFDGMVLDSQVFSLHAVPGNPQQVWASTCGWVYTSKDLGATWTRMREGLTERRTPSFLALPTGRLLAGTVAGIYASDDAGTSWRLQTRADLSVLSLAAHPSRPEVVLVGTEGAGMWRSVDGGLSFRPSSRGVVSARVTAVASRGGELLAAVSHGGPASGIYGSRDGGTQFVHQLSDIPTVLSLAIDGNVAFAGSEGGLYARRDGIWDRVSELKSGRIEQVVAGAGRVLARTPAELYELQAGRFAPVKVPAAPMSAALYGATVVMAGGEGAWQLSGDGARALTVPAAGQIGTAGGRLFLAGPSGVWSHGRGEQGWVEHGKGRARVFATGDAALPALLVRGEEAAIFRAADRSFQAIELPIPPRDVLAATVEGGRLFLGTSGFGLLHAALSELLPSGPSGTTGTVAASQR